MAWQVKRANREVRLDFVRRMQERLNANGAVVAPRTSSSAPLDGICLRFKPPASVDKIS